MKRNFHQPYNRFKGALRERGLTYAKIAEVLSISETSVTQKINGKSDFYLSEVLRLENECGIQSSVFLKQKSCEFNNNINV